MKRLLWFVLLMAIMSVLAAACGGTKTIEVPGETIIKEVQVPGETVVVEKEVIKEVQVPGETVVVTKEVVKEVQVPGETVVVEVEKEVVKGGQLIMGMQLEPDNLDPAVTPWAVSHSVMMNIYDTLVYENHDATFHPGLAESW